LLRIIAIACLSLGVWLVSVPAGGSESIIGDPTTLGKASLIADNILDGYNKGDYARMMRDFGVELKKELTEEKLKQLCESQLRLTNGAFLMKTWRGTKPYHDYAIVSFLVTFEKGSCSMRLTFQNDDPTLRVKGLVFIPVENKSATKTNGVIHDRTKGVIDEFFAAYNDKDSRVLQRHFSKRMTVSLPPEKIYSVVETEAKGKVTAYEFKAVTFKGEFAIVLYEAEFADGTKTQFRFVFDKKHPEEIEGLWFKCAP